MALGPGSVATRRNSLIRNLKLTLACWDYDRTRPLIDGRVKPEGIDLDIEVLRPRQAFQRMLDKKEFDVSELEPPHLGGDRALRARAGALAAGGKRRRTLCAQRGMITLLDSSVAAKSGATSSPPPLAGRDREGAGSTLERFQSPPPQTLPRKRGRERTEPDARVHPLITP
jgi:hypothetical protein